jgi:alpha-glucosidase (family GH31 glycosyl hydrolase)
MYGYSEGKPSLDSCETVTGKRCIIVSRSTFPGVQKSIGHWLGDNTSKWEHVKQSIIGSIEFSLFGFTYTGPDTCGFFGNPSEDMCMRWTQLGAFFVYARNHNGIGNPRQDPASWGPTFAAATKKGIVLFKIGWGNFTRK